MIRRAASWVPLSLWMCACGGSGSTGGPGTATAVPMAKSTLSQDPAAGISNETLAGAVAANNDFAIDLYARLRASGGADNLLVSPFSASLALTMTYAGAAGQTATQMASALHLGSASGSIFDGQNALGQALGARASSALTNAQQLVAGSGAPAPSPDDYRLDVADSVWAQNGATWAPPFLDVLARSYGAGVYLQDFAGQPEAARQRIDAWVSDATADKINDLLPHGSIDPMTRLVLVDAVHLRFPWATPFQAAATAPRTFTTANGAATSTSFLNAVETLPYADDGQAQIVALPLAGGALSVVVALPHGDLAAYEAGLSAASLAQPASSALVSLALPKVSFTTPTFSLETALEAMGMTDAFNPDKADFSAMTPGGGLYVSGVLQKAMVAWQEKGVEAAAATAVVLATTAAVDPSRAIPMVIDRPFVVAIIDVPTGAILFLGHIVDPTDAGAP